MKLAGTVILYYPAEDVIANIRSYVHKLECLYVFDNSEIKDPGAPDKFREFTNIVYLHDGNNSGIAARLNEAAALAIKDGYSWLLTMDQDSHFTGNNLEAYTDCVLSYADKEKVSMFGVQYADRSLAGTACSPELTEKLITSGSVVNLSIFDRVGGFDEKLFIDEVDLEYCYRSIQKGWQVIRFNNIFMEHSLGSKSYHRSLKNLKSTPRVLHSPLRVYYMTRNYFYLNTKYKELFPEDAARRKHGLLNRIKNNMLYGGQRLKTIKYIFKAIVDYKNDKMGKITNR